jgi:hypothetical protein
MIRDYSRVRLMWTRHALAEATEDNFRVEEIAKCLGRAVEFPELDGIKRRCIMRVGDRHCTMILVPASSGFVVVTCWESNPTDISEYDRVTKHGG